MGQINVLDYIKSLVSNYVVAVFILSGIILMLFHGRTNQQNRFPVESKIARFGGIFYIAVGVGIFFIALFL